MLAKFQPPYIRLPDDYKSGTTLETVWRLYSFDRRLRLITADALARIEVAVRAKVMECHALAFNGNPFVYCDHSALPGLRASQFDEFEAMIDKAIRQARNASDPAVAHHAAKYGMTKIPVWMLMENLQNRNGRPGSRHCCLNTPTFRSLTWVSLPIGACTRSGNKSFAIPF